MAAPVLLNDYRMKKTRKIKHPLRESEIPVDLKTFREFHAEFNAMRSAQALQFAAIEKSFASQNGRFSSIDKRFDSIDERFASIDKRFDSIDERFASIDKRFDHIDKRFDAMDLKFESLRADMLSHFHQIKLLLEEQNLRNRQAYDGYLTVYAKVHDLESRIKPEALKD